jgi:hypothetical protein
MRSHSAPKPHAAAPRNKHATARVTVVQSSAVPVEAAANDDKPTSEFSFYGDPLLGMAVASVILFGVLAALMAVG